MIVNWFEILLSLVWASALGIVAATAFIWRMERQHREEMKRQRDFYRAQQESWKASGDLVKTLLAGRDGQ